MHAAKGVVTARRHDVACGSGGARMGKPCVSGVGAIRIDYNAQTMTVGGVS